MVVWDTAKKPEKKAVSARMVGVGRVSAMMAQDDVWLGVVSAFCQDRRVGSVKMPWFRKNWLVWFEVQVGDGFQGLVWVRSGSLIEQQCVYVIVRMQVGQCRGEV